MNKRKLKEIINKSKEISAIGDPFDLFVSSLSSKPENYRLREAWECYDKPKDYNKAIEVGLIKEVNNVPKFASIGYNELTDEYEYLNKGKDNEIVGKDIQVWDNDVIPFVKELKQGGYVRVYDESEDCWKYQKKEENKISNQEIESLKQGGQMNIIPEGALHARKNNMDLAAEGEITHKGIPVVDNEGNQQAEVEKEELTVTKEVTDKLENWYKKFYDEETSKSDKDEIAIKCGKYIAKEILFNTDDRVQLIEKIKQEL